MKIHIHPIILYACTVATLWSCSRVETPSPAAEPGTLQLSVVRSGGTPAGGSPLRIGVYIFSSPAGTGSYTLADSIAPLNDGATYRFPSRDLASRDYRFLFLATPAQAETALGTKSGTAASVGIAWDDIVITALTDTPSTENYYAVQTLSGTQVETARRITGRLTRIVGQPVYEFTRSSDPSAVVPTDVVSDKVSSVLDRIHEIKIQYAGVYKKVAFDADGNLRPYGTTHTTTQTVSPLCDDALKVTIPQPDAGLAAPRSGVKGGVRIMGPCMLPCDALTSSLTFGYYDTTPKCGNSHPAGQTHDRTCFDRRTLTLAIPAAGAGGLAVTKDNYTVSRVGLTCDRVIDIPHSDPISIDFAWN